MRSKKEFNPEEMAQFIDYKFKKLFGNQLTAAEHFEVAQSTISLVCSGKVSPNKEILDCLGYEQVITYKRVK